MSYFFRVDRRKPAKGGSQIKGEWDLEAPRAQTFYLNGGLFILPAKTGQTAFRGALNTGLDLIESEERPTHLTREQLEKNAGNYPVIMTVRHPFARVVSAYFNKFESIYPDFRIFLEEVIQTPDIYADIHVQSMTWLSQGIQPDVIVRQENMDEDYKKARKELSWLPRLLPTANVTGTGRGWKKIITPEWRDALYTRYKGDFETFNYEV